MMAVESQYHGIDVGVRLGYPGSDTPAEDAMPGADVAFYYCGWIIGVTFCVEIILRAIGEKWEFLYDYWNYLDCIVATLWMVDKFGEELLPVNGQILRVVRLTRALRLSRLTSRIQSFDGLYLMVTAIK